MAVAPHPTASAEAPSRRAAAPAQPACFADPLRTARPYCASEAAATAATVDLVGEGRLRLILFAALGWAVVAVVGSGAAPDRSTWLGTSTLDTVLMVGLLAGAAIGLLTLVLLRPGEGERVVKPERRRRSALFVMLAVALLLLLWRPDVLGAFREEGENAAEVQDPPPLPADAVDPNPNREPVAELGDLIGLAAMVVALGGAARLLSLSRGDAAIGRAGPEGLSDRPLAVDGLGAAIADAQLHLAGPTGARQAVIEAYVSLETRLGSSGFERAPAETPEEHLTRSTAALGADPAPFAELGRLYSLARFSDRDIGEHLRTEASGALARASASLAGRQSPQ